MINKSLKCYLFAILFAVFGLVSPLAAGGVLAQGTALEREGTSLIFTLALSEKTPFSVYTLDNPRRLLVDLGGVSLENMPTGLAAGSAQVEALRFGLFQLGQSRIVLDLAVPLVVKSAITHEVSGGMQIEVRLSLASPDEFAAASLSNPASLWRAEQLAPEIVGDAGLPLIAIDAGHGGLDNGAQQDDIFEKDIVLQVATGLRDLLLEDGRFRVILTRETDVYIPLGERVEIARRAGARAFISLHADIVTRGRARGTTVFSLSEAGESQQAVTIATLENRSDLVAGISVEGEDDQLTQILLQLAHRETDALSNRFADTMAEALWFHNELEIKSRRMAGGFRVLRAPDIPSVLIELGFMSDETDLEKLQDSEWQLAMAENLRDGLSRWLQVEDEMRGLLRN
ncbi:MAG: AMIN domain-containing protein [Rhodobacteraceae bacterium]|nr:AMIN domain-containing protein [Paracoccaceae bacterium]